MLWTFLCLLWLQVSHATLFRGPHSARRVRRVRLEGRANMSADTVERRDTPSASATGGGSCTLGAWQCVGQELQRCYNDKWNTWTTCDGTQTVCDASNPLVAPGCVWASGPSAGLAASSNAVATTSVPPATSVAGSTGSSNVASLPTSLPASLSSLPVNNYYVNPDASTGASGSAVLSTPASSGAYTSQAGASAPASTASPATASVSPSTSSGNSSGTHGSADASQFKAPHYVMYTDNVHYEFPKASELLPINRYLLAFWLTNSPDYDNSYGPYDVAEKWSKMSSSARQAILDDYHSNGIALLVSAFGSTDAPVTRGVDPVEAGQKLAEFCTTYGLDGVDLDWEDGGSLTTGKGEEWLISFHQTLRKSLPVGQYLITHAPQPQYLAGVSQGYPNGGYVTVNEKVGDTIDFYNVQYYNQPNLPYEDCASIIDSCEGTAIMEVNKNAGIPLDKLVLGKPLSQQFVVSRGLMTASQLNTCVKDARGKGWNAGIMAWQMDSTGQAFFKEATTA